MYEMERGVKEYMLTKTEIVLSIVVLDLLLVIIWLLTYPPNENFFSHFSFASTVASIILSILAIFMSVIGEAKTQIIRDRIEQEAKEIANITSCFEANMKNLLSNTEIIIKNTDSIKAVVNEKPNEPQITSGRANDYDA